MTEAEFRRSIRETRPLLEGLGVLRSPMRFPRPPSADFRAAAFNPGTRYSDLFLIGLRSHDYCFLLEDHSYFQFYHDTERAFFSVRYAYLPNPFPFVTLDQFLDENSLSGSDPEAIEFYHQYLGEQEAADGVGPFRYEVDFRAYRELRHACAHLHVGHKTPMRLPVERVLSPKAFVLLMTKHHLPEAWCGNDGAEGVPNPFDEALGIAREACEPLDDEWMTRLERADFTLS